MEGKTLAQFFNRNGLYLRPTALTLLIPELKAHPEQNSFLNNLLQSIRSIFLEKNTLSCLYVEPDIAQEALYLLQQKKPETGQEAPFSERPVKIDRRMPIEKQRNSNEQNDQVLLPTLILLSNYESLSLRFDEKSKKTILKEAEVNFEENTGSDLVTEKYAFLRFLIEKAGKYYFEQRQSEKSTGKKKITEIGSLKGQHNAFTVFGVIYQKKGQFYLQDQISEVRLNFSKTAKTKGYFGIGSFALVQGVSDDGAIIVHKLKYPKINLNVTPEPRVLHKIAFYDSLKGELQNMDLKSQQKDIKNIAEIGRLGLQENELGSKSAEKDKQAPSLLSSEIYHLNAQFEQFKDSSEVLFINDLRLTDANIKNLEKVVCEVFGRGVVALFLCGPFFEFNAFSGKADRLLVKRSIKQLYDLFAKYKPFLSQLRIFIVPAVDDFGLACVPKRQTSFSVWEKILGDFPNVRLAQNPCSFMLFNKSFTISKLNVISKGVRSSVAPTDGNIEPFEHLQATVLGQRDLLPFSFQEYPTIPRLRHRLVLFEVPDFLVLADDFAAPNTTKYSGQNSEGFLLFPGSFNNFGSYGCVQPIKGTIEIKCLF